MAIFMTAEERKLLGQRGEREKFSCPECGEPAERERNGDWRCLGEKQINEFPPISQQSCGARGVTLPDGDWGTTRGSLHAH